MEPALDIRPGTDADAVTSPGVADDDTVRANTYGLLGALLANPPHGELLDLLASIDPPSADGLGAAWSVLKRAAERAEVEAVDDEYHDPLHRCRTRRTHPLTGSWYLTGFMMDKPLACSDPTSPRSASSGRTR